MFRSATFKLTLWYLGLVMAISIIFSIILYQVGSNQLAVGLDHQSARIYDQFPVFHNDPILHPSADIASGDHGLLLKLVGFNFLVFIGAGFGSYALARRTLIPIEEAHEQQKRFTADVSHELRTPLTALKMESEVALMSADTSVSELRQTLESNLEEANKLEVLINNLLRLTRLEADELRLEFMPVDTDHLVEQALKTVEKAAETHKISLEHHVKDLQLMGDEASLTQLLVILLDNAIKYSTKGSNVTLSIEQSDDNAVIKVVDHGIGISQTALDHIFDRFYRADESRKKTGSGGFGLGLSIAKMIADLHDGVIVISSRAEHGTTATVTIPLSKNDKPQTKK